eukprot:10052045-Prorocentrum_lima.AAC.1
MHEAARGKTCGGLQDAPDAIPLRMMMMGTIRCLIMALNHIINVANLFLKVISMIKPSAS